MVASTATVTMIGTISGRTIERKLGRGWRRRSSLTRPSRSGGGRCSDLVRPSLTSVRIDREQMGARAVEMLMQMRSDPDGPPRRMTVDVSLVRRDSA